MKPACGTALYCALFLLIIESCAPSGINTAPYQSVLNCADAAYSEAGRVNHIKFCVLGEPGSKYGNVVAAYKTVPSGEFKRVFMDQDHGIKPWKVAVCELDGDPLPEVAVAVYKPARYFPEPDNRLHIYDWMGESLAPKWLGSRLALPFIDFVFIPGDDLTDRLVALEHLHEREFYLRMYKWNGFGFTGEADPIQVGSREEGLNVLQSLLKGRSWSSLNERK